MNLEVVTSSQEIESSNKQVTELRRQLQALEINVQAQLTMVGDARRMRISDSPSLFEKSHDQSRTCSRTGSACSTPRYLCLVSIRRKKTWNPRWQKPNVATTNTCLSSRARSRVWSSGWLRSEQRWSVRTRSTRPFWTSNAAWSKRFRPTTACWRADSRTSCTSQ